MKIEEIKKYFDEALQELLLILENRPELLLRRETQVHFELVHLLMYKMEQNYKRFKDYDLIIDSAEGIKVTGELPSWALLADLRPDIVIKSFDNDGLDLVVELKILRSLQNIESYNLEDICDFVGKCRGMKSQLADYYADVEKLESIADMNGGKKFKCYMLAFHIHETPNNSKAVSELFTEIKWREKIITASHYEIRYSLSPIDYDPKRDEMDFKC
ncbi:MAG: hypothetical protein ABR969_05880 [Sedimentisphaerales bacterium]